MGKPRTCPHTDEERNVSKAGDCVICRTERQRKKRVFMSDEARKAKYREYQNKYRATDKGKAAIKRAELNHKYGITEIPISNCQICGNGDLPIVVDHNHTTGDLRGFLCSHCNIGLGQFKDNPTLLWRAIQYLGDSE
jgi:hypothetical protein